MSSFSSVVRKPGGKIAPKVAPRRNLVRKTPASSNPEATQQEPVSVEKSLDIAGASPSDTAHEIAASEQPDVAINNYTPATQDQPSTEQQDQAQVEVALSLTDHNVVPPESSRVTSSSNLPSVQHTEVAESQASALPSWPSQKPRPARNASISRTRTRRPSVTQSVTEAASDVPNGVSPGTVQDATIPADAQTPTAPAKITKSTSKRKQKPRASVDFMLSQSAAAPPTPPTTQPSRTPTRERTASVASRRRARSASSRRSEPQSEAEEAFANITQNLQRSIRELTASIDPQRANEAAQSAAESHPDERPSKRRRKNNNAPTSVEQRAAAVVAAAVGDSDESLARGRRRKRTPEDPESHKIEPASTLMDDLLAPRHKWGKKSDKEKEMAENWQEILRRRRADADARYEAAQRRQSRKSGIKAAEQLQENSENQVSTALQIQIENGRMVPTTREFDQTQTAQLAVLETAATDVLEDTDIYKRVNSSTVGSKQRTRPGQHWDEVTMDLFYKGLQMFGTDFGMIAGMIPGKNRKQVKHKFISEERTNLSKLRWHMANKVAVDLGEYKQATGREDEWADAAQVYKDMEEEEKRLREEDEARRRQEGIIPQPGDNTVNPDADIAMPSIEGEDTPADDGDDAVEPQDRQSTAAASRLGSTTTARQTTQPATKRKQTRKAASTSKRGRQAANKNKGFEGVEEALGNVTEIGIPVS